MKIYFLVLRPQETQAVFNLTRFVFKCAPADDCTGIVWLPNQLAKYIMQKYAVRKKARLIIGGYRSMHKIL